MNVNNIQTILKNLTEQKIENILNFWELKPVENKEWIENFKSLVRLGDSREMAMATTLEVKRYESNRCNIVEAYKGMVD